MNLSELFIKCDELVNDCVYLSGHKDKWTAVDGRDGFGFYGGSGKTPQEAMENLYSELKQK